MKNTLSVAVLATLLATTAQAEPTSTGYVGVQYAQTTYDEPGFDTFQPTALIGRFGGYVAENLAIEGRFGLGLGDDSRTYYIYGTPVKIELGLDNLFGVYAVGHLPVNNAVSFYGVLGYTKAQLRAKVSVAGFSASASNDDSTLSWGAGAEVHMNRNTALTVEYMSYLSTSDYTFTAVSAGVNFGF